MAVPSDLARAAAEDVEYPKPKRSPVTIALIVVVLLIALALAAYFGGVFR